MIRNEEIQKELEDVAPYLASHELRLGFKVPKGYFEELPETVLESISPLAVLKPEQAFTVPANYFESLPDLVLERVVPKPIESPTHESVVTSSWLDDLINSIAVLFQPRYALRLAGIAILIVGGFFMLQNSFEGITNETVGLVEVVTENPLQEYGIRLDDLTDDDLSLLLAEDMKSGTSEDLEPYLEELLDNLDELTDDDLEELM